MDLLSSIILVGSIQGFILAFLLLFRNQHTPSIFLGISLAIISTALLQAHLSIKLNFVEYSYLIKTSISLSLLFIPTLYIYLKLVTGVQAKATRSDFVHFIPALILIVYNLPFYFGDINRKIKYYQRVDLEGQLNLADKLEELYISTIVMIFSILAFKIVPQYRISVKEFYSDTHQAKVHWLKWLTVSMFILVSFSALMAFTQLFTSAIPRSMNFFTAIGSTFLVYYLSYYMLFHPNVFSVIRSEMKTNQVPNASRSKQLQVLQIHAKKVQEAIAGERLYRDPELTLSKLSIETEIPTYLLSKVIKNELATNFHTLIN